MLNPFEQQQCDQNFYSRWIVGDVWLVCVGRAQPTIVQQIYFTYSRNGVMKSKSHQHGMGERAAAAKKKNATYEYEWRATSAAAAAAILVWPMQAYKVKAVK